VSRPQIKGCSYGKSSKQNGYWWLRGATCSAVSSIRINADWQDRNPLLQPGDSPKLSRIKLPCFQHAPHVSRIRLRPALAESAPQLSRSRRSIIKPLRTSRKKGPRIPLKVRCALAETAIHYQLGSHVSHERATKCYEASMRSRSKEPLY
jgi:hypothetical protein